ncbi:MAG: hypothetical protein ACR2G4_05130 [Pyrinomonadaceae bacterium]
MSVIGRLDEQVEAVIISPLKHRPTPEGKPCADEPDQTPAPPEPGAEPDEGEVAPPLPVWLL